MNSFLTGLATGLAIGYLTAPRSGKETRDQLTEAVDKQTKSLKDQVNKTTGQVTKLVDDVKSQVNSAKPKHNLFADMEQGKLDRFKDDAELTKAKAKNKYNDSVDDAADATKSGVDKAEEALKF